MRRFFILMLGLGVTLPAFSQDPPSLRAMADAYYARLDSLDEQYFQTPWNLNRGFAVPDLLEPFAALQPGVPGHNYLRLPYLQWEKLWLGAAHAPRRGHSVALAEAYPIVKEYEATAEQVPLGFLGLRGEWLTPEEVTQNLSDQRHQPGRARSYRKVSLLAGAALRPRVSQPTVEFVADKRLYYVEGPYRARLMVDVSDGEGFREVSPGTRFTTTYPYPGEKLVVVKWNTPEGEVINYSSVWVDYDPHATAPDSTLTLGAPSTIGPMAQRGDLGTATAQIRRSCDGVLDKPFIIVEGWDPLNTQGHFTAYQKLYFPTSTGTDRPSTQLAEKGYDLITVNWNDGGADIRTLAPALEELLGVLNALKVGDHPITIMGISMGGLVTRYCLTSMEARGLNHQVGLFISYDTPHRGANYPVGFQKLYMTLDDLTVLNFFNIPLGRFEDGKTALYAPASRQMLLRFLGPNPHPDYTEFFNEMNARGWPSCRNVALVNGSSLGQRQLNVEGGTYNPGDLLFDADMSVLLSFAFVEVRTNRLDAYTTLSNFTYWQLGLPPIPLVYGRNLGPVNYDLAPGGFQDQLGAKLAEEFSQEAYDRNFEVATQNEFNLVAYLKLLLPLVVHKMTDYGRSNLTFAPLFSTVASTETISAQHQLERSVSQYMSMGLTPMDAVYSQSTNTIHNNSFELDQALPNLISAEFPEPQNSTCGDGMVNHPNATPLSIGGPQTTCNTLTDQVAYRVVDELVGIINYYDYTWRLKQGSTTLKTWTSSSLNPRAGIQIMGGTYPNGVYTLELERKVNYFASQPKFASRVIELTTVGCSGVAPPSPCEDPFDPDCMQRGFTISPNPAQDWVALQLDIPEGTSVTIDLIPIMEPQRYHRLYQGTYMSNLIRQSLQNVPSGLYIIRAITSEGEFSQKIIINE